MSFYGIDVGSKGDGTAETAEILEILEILKPKASARPLIRIGENCDGSYLVPDDLHGVAACYSPGVNKIKYFEDYLTDNYDIECHMCDFSCEARDFKTALRPGMQTFSKKWLDTTPGEDNISLEDWVGNSLTEGDLILQMDIEGAEYRNIIFTPDEILSRFRIIVLEVHGLGKLRDAEVLRSVMNPFFKKISRMFTCVHAHPNNCCGDFPVQGTDVRIPNVLELTFVRNDRFASGAHEPQLPHPLDVSRNLPRNPPLFLVDAWCGHNRPIASRLKMLEDTMEYQDSVILPQLKKEYSDMISMMLRSLQTCRSIPKHEASPTGADGNPVDVAAGCRYLLSTAYGASKRTGVVKKGASYFFHTGFGTNQYIQIDLGRSQNLRGIRIKNRMDGFRDRARHIFVILSETSNAGFGSVFPVLTTSSMSGEWGESEVYIPDVECRFVTITSTAETALHFSSVEALVDGAVLAP